MRKIAVPKRLSSPHTALLRHLPKINWWRSGESNPTQSKLSSVQPMQASRLSVTICLLPITDLSSMNPPEHSHAPAERITRLKQSFC